MVNHYIVKVFTIRRKGIKISMKTHQKAGFDECHYKFCSLQGFYYVCTIRQAGYSRHNIPSNISDGRTGLYGCIVSIPV